MGLYHAIREDGMQEAVGVEDAYVLAGWRPD